MEDIFYTYLCIAFLGFLVLTAFLKWIIKSSVKQALEEFNVDSKKNREEYQNTISIGVLKALEQYNNGKSENFKKDIDE